MERKKLKEIRERKNLSQFDIASLLNMEQSTYSRKEHGETRLTEDDLINLSKVLNCKIEDLIEDTTFLNIQHDNKSAIQNINTNNEITNLFLQHIEKSDERFEKIFSMLIKLVTENKHM